MREKMEQISTEITLIKEYEESLLGLHKFINDKIPNKLHQYMYIEPSNELCNKNVSVTLISDILRENIDLITLLYDNKKSWYYTEYQDRLSNSLKANISFDILDFRFKIYPEIILFNDFTQIVHVYKMPDWLEASSLDDIKLNHLNALKESLKEFKEKNFKITYDEQILNYLALS